MTRNQISYWEYEERKRSNLATEKETNRSNLAREKETNRHNVVTEQETERHNRAMEEFTLAQVQEQARHNQAAELQATLELEERKRSNRENEAIGRLNVALGFSRLAEESRHNQVGEEISLFSALETQRAHRQSETFKQDELDETKRSNEAKEEQARLNWIQGYSSLGETGRHNIMSEEIDRYGTKHRVYSNYIRSIADLFKAGVSAVSH